MTDFHVHNHGSIFLVEPLHGPAKEHLEDHIDDEAQWFGHQLVVEPRYIVDLVALLQDDGWEVS